MFIPIKFDTINSTGDIPLGRYEAHCSVFASDSGEVRKAMVWKYQHADFLTPAAIDLLLIERDGAVRARDFVWMPDLSWRDSAGARSNSLLALLPTALTRMTLVREQQAEDITLENPRG